MAWRIKRWQKGPSTFQAKRAERHIGCLEREKDRAAIQRARGEQRAHFRLYKEYRAIATVPCGSGPYKWWSIPCYVIACESGYSWSAYNPSGAAGPYQLMPEWGRIYPARSFEAKVQNHRIAASLALSNWVCA